MEYATDTALDHMTVMDKKTRSRYISRRADIFTSRVLPTYYIENGTGGVMNCREPAPAA
jgi:hypothetical protein